MNASSGIRNSLGALSLRFCAALGAVLATASTAGATEAGDVSLGVGLVGALDLTDAGPDHGSLGPGGGLLVPVRVALSPQANLRATLRSEYLHGKSDIAYSTPDGTLLYSTEGTHFLGTSLTVGAEIVLVDSNVAPYLSASVGGAYALKAHTNIDHLSFLRDVQGSTFSSSSIDMNTAQLVPLAEVGLGTFVGGSRIFFAELGYSSAWLPPKALAKSAPDLGATSVGVGYNAIRLGLGLNIAL